MKIQIPDQAIITGMYCDKTISVRVTGFKPFFYLLVPDTWNKTIASELYTQVIEKRMGRHKDLLNGFKFIKKMKLYPYTAFKKFNFIKLEFKNKSSYYTIRKLFSEEVTFRNSKKKFILYESRVDFLNKFCHDLKVMTTGLIKLNIV